MFFNTKKKIDPKKYDASSNIIGKGTNIKGDINATGNIRLEGNVTGEISSKAKVVLGSTSVVEGDIIAQNGEIGGIVKGAVKVSELLILRASAVVDGDIFANKLVLEEGAKFNGKCRMGEKAKEHHGQRNHEIHDVKDEQSIEIPKKTAIRFTQQA